MVIKGLSAEEIPVPPAGHVLAGAATTASAAASASATRVGRVLRAKGQPDQAERNP